MAEDGIDVREEYFDNMATGVEAEFDGEQPGIARPWDPDDIRVGTKQFSLRNILDLIDDGDLELAPDFQRNKVWKARQKSRLIESILLQIPLPAFYFAEDTSGMMRVVDGLQRLSAVHSYVRGRQQAFALTDLEYLGSAEKKRFEELAPALRRRINNAQIVVHVIDPTTPPDVKYDIFKRINTGGTPLNAQEIRHCMSRKRSRSSSSSARTLQSFQSSIEPLADVFVIIFGWMTARWYSDTVHSGRGASTAMSGRAPWMLSWREQQACSTIRRRFQKIA
ncbi:GmrSD restriction endonuclease domain-containing protein [Frankia sp. CiP1_Cm_nod2]|uniref:GmrSD restriction endonuclease domain-containing protein n=1 Tax=Frankia sp. CiP1_Cm_nod2 TaxID=2897161 RepID=UPI002024D41E